MTIPPMDRDSWLITGAAGMLGRELVTLLLARDIEVTALARADLDVTDRAGVHDAIGSARPTVVANCAAWTRVDDAESAEDTARRVNGDAVQHIAEACRSVGARLVQPSTDYVFAGDTTVPYPEDASTAPRSAYGRSKLLGEHAVLATLPQAGFVVRTAWLYGAYGRNFVATMVRLERDRETIDVVDDQYGQPTWTGDLASQVVSLVAAGAPAGVYHATNAGRATWYELAREVFALLHADPARVRPTTTDRFPRPAARPAFSVLGHEKWARVGLAPMREWPLALRDALPAVRYQVLRSPSV
jgi:dTDP-4-dehydrorhamnose reductase